MKYYKIEDLAEELGKSVRTVYYRLKEIYNNKYDESQVEKDGKRLLYSEDILKTLKHSWELYDNEDDMDDENPAPSEEGGNIKVLSLDDVNEDYLVQIIEAAQNSMDNSSDTLDTIAEARVGNKLATASEVLSLMNMSSQVVCNYCGAMNLKHSALDALDKR